jgi:hypothetical protein
MTDVPPTEALGQQHFDWLPEQLFARIAEQHFSLSVHDLDQARCIDDDYSVRSRLQQPAELGFRSFVALTSDRRHVIG